MSKELKHKDAGVQLGRTEDNAVDRHYIVGGSNEDIPVYDSANKKLVGRTPAELLSMLFDQESSVLTYLELDPDIDYETIRGQNGIPTEVKRGIIPGFSLPIYSANNEELYFKHHVPARWQGATDISVHVDCYLATANTDKNFNFTLAWEHFSIGEIVPSTSHDVSTQTATGTASQYMSFEVLFTIDYDIDAGDAILNKDELHFRLRRVSASANEASGEIVITHIGVVFQKNKLGDPV